MSHPIRAVKVFVVMIGALAMTLGLATAASATTTIDEAFNCDYRSTISGVKFYHCDGFWFHNYGYPQRRLRIVADQTVAINSDYHTTRITRIESTDATTKNFQYFCRNKFGSRWKIGDGKLGGDAPWFWDYQPNIGSQCDGTGTGIEIRVADYYGNIVTWVQMNVTNYLGGPGVHAGVPEEYR
jgi:hypothetical protein